MEEVWKEIVGLPGYDISDLGRVRNQKTGRIMKTTITEYGYETLQVTVHGRTQNYRIARLVAAAFLGGNHPDLDVRHKNRDKLNSHADNLEWSTRKDIHRNSDRAKKIRIIETGETFGSLAECSEAIGLSVSYISKCLHNPSCRNRLGYHFESVD